MVKVVFVGDEPSQTNIDPDIAFVGAKCFQRLTEWINYLSPDYYICLNSHSDNDMFKIERLAEAGFKIVTLGVKASERLKERDLNSYKLPHPSGLNRQLNDKTAMKDQLDACVNWLKDVPISGAV